MDDFKTGLPKVDKDIAESLSSADAALESANAQELHALVYSAQKDHAEMMRTFNTVVAHYVGKKDQPLYQTRDAIEAMRDVALAAIQLAQSTVNKAQ